jgi:hypothetical protein
MARHDNELHNLWCGDYLLCQACGCIIYASPLQPFSFRFAEITGKYNRHLKDCMGLKRIVVTAMIHERNITKNNILTQHL